MTTVVIVSYNYAMFVAQAIESVLAQTKKADSILVVDDGAHDGIDEIAKKFNVSYLIRNHNLGILDNFNDILFNQVKTDKMMMLGADNWLHPLYLEKMDFPLYDIVSCDVVLVGEMIKNLKLKESEKYYYKDGYWIRKFRNYDNITERIMRSNVIHGSAIFNVDLAKKSGGYKNMKDKSRKKEEDWGLYQNLIKAGAKYMYVASPLLYYRRHRFNTNGIYKI